MIRRAGSMLYTRGLYAATALLVVIGLVLQVVPSTRRLEASSTNESIPSAGSETNAGEPLKAKPQPETFDAEPGDSPVELPHTGPLDSPAPGRNTPPGARGGARDLLPGEFQAVAVANIFSPDRAPPRARYSPRGTAPEPAEAPAPVRSSNPRARLFGVTLRANGAVALIDADPAVPGAEIYRVGDAIAGGRLVEIGPASVVIERRSGRQTIRLEAEPSARGRSRVGPADSVGAPRDSLRDRQ